MRRDVPTQIVLDYGYGQETCATELEAKDIIRERLTDDGLPQAAWLEDSSGRRKWNYEVIEDASGEIELVSGPVLTSGGFFRPIH